MREHFENIINHYFQVVGLAYIVIIAVALGVAVMVLQIPISSVLVLTLCAVVMGSVSHPFPIPVFIGIEAVLFLVGTLMVSWMVGILLVVFFATSLGMFRLFAHRDDQA